MRPMFFAFVCAFFSLLFCSEIHAQKDSTETETFDIVYLKEGGALKGEIVVFEEADGDITFRDIHGRMYSLAREDYDYFIEDKVFDVKKRGAKELRARKQEGLEVSVGFSLHSVIINPDYVDDGYYLETSGSVSPNDPNPFDFRVALGKYYGRQHYLGVNAETSVFANAKSYNSFGLRYSYQYDNNTRNTALYLPIEVDYSRLVYNPYFQVMDSANVSVGYFGTSIEPTHTINSIDLKIGQGLAFILPNEKSIAIELLFSKSFILSDEYEMMDGRPAPSWDFKMSGLRFSFVYNI